MTSAVTLVLFPFWPPRMTPWCWNSPRRIVPPAAKRTPSSAASPKRAFPFGKSIAGTKQARAAISRSAAIPTFVLVSGGREVSRIEGAASRETAHRPAQAGRRAARPVWKCSVRGQSPNLVGLQRRGIPRAGGSGSHRPFASQ